MSGAPFVITRYFPLYLCIVVIILRFESNGISATLGISLYKSFLFKLYFKPFCTSAISVGSPLMFFMPLCSIILLSVHIVANLLANNVSLALTSTTVILF